MINRRSVSSRAAEFERKGKSQWHTILCNARPVADSLSVLRAMFLAQSFF
jgi:hypothetical protein